MLEEPANFFNTLGNPFSLKTNPNLVFSCHNTELAGSSWGPARNTDLADSRLRSGTQHWSRRLAVEVRHATLISQTRRWGPARNTDLANSRLRSGAAHWSRRLAVEVRRGTLISQTRRWGPARNTDRTGLQRRKKKERKEEEEEEEEKCLT